MFRYETRQQLTKNAAHCLLCDEVVVSESVHHFQPCSCGNISVDGGNYYARRVGSQTSTNPETGEQTWVDVSEYETHVINKETSETVMVLAPGEEIPPQYQRPFTPDPVPASVAHQDVDS